MDWVEIIIAILSGLAACIPLVIKLVQYVEKAIKEKNWSALLELIMSYMEEAEQKFEDGATRKEWVMAMIRNSAEQLNYDIDMQVVSDLIDRLCDMSNVVNPPADEASVANA